MLGDCIADLLDAEARSDPGPALARAGARIARLAQGRAVLLEQNDETNWAVERARCLPLAPDAENCDPPFDGPPPPAA